MGVNVRRKHGCECEEETGVNVRRKHGCECEEGTWV